MADDNSNGNSGQDKSAASAGESDKDQKGATQDKSSSDAVALAEKVGKLEAENANLKQYQERVDPVIQTIWSDSDTLQKVTDVHNKRLGINVNDDKSDKKDDKIATTPVKPSATELDNRNGLIKTIVDKFSTDKGIDKLEKDKQAELNTRVGAELKEMLDPMGNKSLQQIMETVSVTKLPQFLDKAWFLATRNEQMQMAKSEGRKEVTDEGTGVIGSMASSSVTPDSVILSSKEKDVAQKLGISPEKYLENKKEIMKRDGQLF